MVSTTMKAANLNSTYSFLPSDFLHTVKGEAFKRENNVENSG
ncbi:hypothetical protein ADU37_CDS04910 [Thermococcus sp. 2319x1]|nr:hypothetical protein ADU37_CDS04910 [Thermococcus sp. 2319x1]